jgi:hypothetical protein
MNEKFGNIINFTFALVTLVVGVIIRSYLIGTLYYWFVVPLYDLDPLTMAQAFGLSVFISFLTYSGKSRMERTWEEQNELDVEGRIGYTITVFFNMLLINGFYLFMGWIGTQFI